MYVSPSCIAVGVAHRFSFAKAASLSTSTQYTSRHLTVPGIYYVRMCRGTDLAHVDAVSKPMLVQNGGRELSVSVVRPQAINVRPLRVGHWPSLPED